MFKKKSASVVGLDVSCTSVKLLELSQVGPRYRVECYCVLPLPVGAVVEKEIKDADAVRDCIVQAIKESGTKANKAVVAVASSSVMNKVIQMEAGLSMDDLELQIELEADRYIPYPIDEVNLDFEVIGPCEGDPDNVDVMLVASHSDNVSSRVNVVEAAGLQVTIVDVESYVLERTFSLLLEQLSNMTSESVVAVLDVGASMTTLSVMNHDSICYTREEVFGGKLLTEEIQRRYGLSYQEAGKGKRSGGLPEDYIPEVLNPFKDAVVQHTSRALQFFFSSTEFDEVDHILLAGGCAAIPGLAELIQERIGVTVTVANPLADMNISKRINAMELSVDAPALLISCGLAMRGLSQ